MKNIKDYKMLQELMDDMPDAIYFKDKKSRLVLVNKSHARGLGYTTKNILGKTDFDLFKRKQAVRMFRDDKYVMSTGKPLLDKIERSTRPDGLDNYVSTTKIPRFDSKGKVIGLIGITRDITSRVYLERLREEEKQTKKKIEALEEINRMKSEFVSVVSHELRTPLAIIKEANSVILDGLQGPVSEGQKKVLLTVKDNIERLRRIVEEILDISRIERGTFKIHYSLVNLNDLITDSSGFFKELAARKDVSLECKLPDKEVNIFIDAGRINQVISNLIDNAIKFTEQGGSIEIQVKILEDKVRVGVIDTGIGIAKEDLSRIFNKFVQVSKKSEAKSKGLGLGLSIIKELVERHGGEIWAESKLGTGSKFYFTIPRFYTKNVLEKGVRDRINQLLNKDIPFYLIDLLIVRYEEFTRLVRVAGKALAKDINSIIGTILKEFPMLPDSDLTVHAAEFRHGECSIIFPKANEKSVRKLTESLKEKIGEYFSDKKTGNIFVNVGVEDFTPKAKRVMAEEVPADVCVKKVYIGAGKRRYSRVEYRASVELAVKKDKAHIAHTLDISEGGMCITTRNRIPTDARLDIHLHLPSSKELLPVKGRVAWRRESEDHGEKGAHKYKIGLQFINISKRAKKAISKFIKTASRQHKKSRN